MQKSVMPQTILKAEDMGSRSALPGGRRGAGRSPHPVRRPAHLDLRGVLRRGRRGPGPAAAYAAGGAVDGSPRRPSAVPGRAGEREYGRLHVGHCRGMVTYDATGLSRALAAGMVRLCRGPLAVSEWCSARVWTAARPGRWKPASPASERDDLLATVRVCAPARSVSRSPSSKPRKQRRNWTRSWRLSGRSAPARSAVASATKTGGSDTEASHRA
jgi:hypothetical protein